MYPSFVFPSSPTSVYSWIFTKLGADVPDHSRELRPLTLIIFAQHNYMYGGNKEKKSKRQGHFIMLGTRVKRSRKGKAALRPVYAIKVFLYKKTWSKFLTQTLIV